MKPLRALLLAALLAAGAHTALGADAGMQRLGSIAVPGRALESFDIADAADGWYALADRSNAAVDLVHLRSGRFVAQVGGFAGAVAHGRGGPNGVLVAQGRVWAGDGDSSVKVIDLATRSVVARVSTGGTRRVDELAIDPRDHLLIAANNADQPPFLTLISTDAPYAVRGRVVLARASDGLEQPRWDPRTGRIEVAIPELDGVAGRGGVAIVDPRQARIENVWPVARCMPASLAIGPGHDLLVGCSDDAVAAGYPAHSVLLDARDGRQLASFDEVGGSDEIVYDAATRRYLLAAVANPGGPVLGVIDAGHRRWLANLPSGRHAHSVAAAGGRAYMALAAGDPSCPQGCIAVFGP